MNPDADRKLDALLRAVREMPLDTARAEYGFETRLFARLREERSGSFLSLAWKLCPFFAALAIAVGLWSRTTAARVQADAHVLREAARSGHEHVFITYLTGERR